jgi:hypothetical protein
VFLVYTYPNPTAGTRELGGSITVVNEYRNRINHVTVDRFKILPEGRTESAITSFTSSAPTNPPPIEIQSLNQKPVFINRHS